MLRAKRISDILSASPIELRKILCSGVIVGVLKADPFIGLSYDGDLSALRALDFDLDLVLDLIRFFKLFPLDLLLLLTFFPPFDSERFLSCYTADLNP